MKLIELAVGRKKISAVAGLVWFTLDGFGSARAKQLLAYAQSSSCELKVTRGDESAHVGLASKHAGARIGLVSAAAVVADMLAAQGKTNALVALRLPEEGNEFFFLSVREGVILADGDVVAPEAEVQQRLTADRSYGGWDAVICPAEWSVPGSVPGSFDDFFTRASLKKAKQYRLKNVQLDIRRLLLAIGAVAVVAAVTTMGWKGWKQRQAVAAAHAEAMRIQQEEQEAAARAQAAQASAPTKPWPNLPRPAEFAKACARAFVEVGRTAGNWKLDGAGCEAGQLSVRWVKGGEQAAWVSHLRAVRPDAVVSPDGQSATVTSSAPAAPAADASESLLDPLPVSLRFVDLASRYGITITTEAPKPAAARNPQAAPGAANVPSAPEWAEMAVQVSTSLDPVVVADLLDVAGLRFTKLVFAFSQEGLPIYKFSGVQYVRP